MFEEQDIVVNKAVLKALGAETRVAILKSLEKRQKTPSELSSELKLAVPTILEHLSHLETAKLIERHDDGHKWKYYALTKTGKQIKSGTPLRVLILLAIGVLFLFTGFMYVPTISSPQMQTSIPTESAQTMDEPIASKTAPRINEYNALSQNSLDENTAIAAGTPVQGEIGLGSALPPNETLIPINTLFASIGCLVLGLGLGYWLKR